MIELKNVLFHAPPAASAHEENIWDPRFISALPDKRCLLLCDVVVAGLSVTRQPNCQETRFKYRGRTARGNMR